MAELRSSLPYVSHLRVTKRPTQNWVSSGYQNREGQDLYQQVMDLPGIECEITPYMGTVKGPATQFKFPSKAFFEAELAKLQAKPTKTEQETAAIANIQATIARTDVVWVETVLMAGGLPTLDALWATVFSDALDEFPTWREVEDAVGGIPIGIKEMQWDARIPYESAKAIQLKIGMYRMKRVGTQWVIDESVMPVIHTLNFEDEQTKAQRLSYNNQIQERVAQLTAQIAAMANGPAKVQAQAELDRFTQELAQRNAVEQGVLLDLVSNPSVQASLPALIMAIIGTLRTLHWPDLDMAVVQERLAENLSVIK